jgi:hypothetical protein
LGVGEPLILGIDAHCPDLGLRDHGLDGTVAFEPQLSVLAGFNEDGISVRRLFRNVRLGALTAQVKIYDGEQARTLTAPSLGESFYPGPLWAGATLLGAVAMVSFS